LHFKGNLEYFFLCFLKDGNEMILWKAYNSLSQREIDGLSQFIQSIPFPDTVVALPLEPILLGLTGSAFALFKAVMSSLEPQDTSH
jgi:hypothetical protein